MTKRSHGSGTMAERPPGSGRWQLRAYCGTDPITGRPLQKAKTVQARTKTEATRLLSAFITECASEPPTVGRSAPVRALLTEWVKHARVRGLSPRTIHDAERAAETAINPELGDIPIAELTARHLDEWYRKLLTGEGRARPLKPASVRRHHAVLSAALAEAVRWGWIDRNPAATARPPKLPAPTLRVPSAEDINRLITKADEAGVHWGFLLRLAAMTGARRGELCALRWTDVVDGHLRISRSIYRAGKEAGEKSTKSGRARAMPLAPGAQLLLDGWRLACERRAAAGGVELVPDAFVATSWPDGSRPLNPDTISTQVGRWCDELGIPHVHLHSIRHFAATELLGAGVAPQDVAELLGHANSAITLRVYAHATSDRQAAAAGILSRALMPAESPAPQVQATP